MEPRRRKFAIAAIVLTGLWVACAYHYVLGNYFRLPYPSNSFLFVPSNVFGDFGAYFIASHAPSPYLIPGWAVYFPFAYVLGKPITWITGSITLWVFLASFIIGWTWCSVKMLWNTKSLQDFLPFFILTYMTFPFMFAIDRANPEIWVFLSIMGFALAFKHERYDWAAILLSPAIAMKATPAALAFLFLARGRGRSFLLTAEISLALTLISLCTFHGTIVENVHAFLGILHRYNSELALDASQGMGFHDFGHSLFGLLRVLNILTGAKFNPIQLNRVYMPLSIIAAMIFMAHAVWVEKVFWRRLMISLLTMSLFPLISADYRLIHFLIPILMFLNDPERTQKDGWLVVLFGLLLIPKNYRLIGIGYDGDIADPLLLMAIACILLKQSWRRPIAKISGHSVPELPLEVG